jgi:DNA-binding beta-propeller fold protein YncE
MRFPISSIFLLATLGGVSVASAQTPAAEPDPATLPFVAGTPLETTPNVRVYGSFRFAESCSYDETRDLIVTPNLGVPNDAIENDGYVSLINPDGTVHTLKWIGVDRNGLTLNQPRGSDIMGGLLYLADDNVVRTFDMETGEPRDNFEVADATSFNDIEVMEDGTIYASQTGNDEGVVGRLYRINADGSAEVFFEGEPLNRPNGVAFDQDGNIVVVQIGDNKVMTFSPEGELLLTEESTNPGNDGIVILEDGTKYVSSVREGVLAVIRPGQPAERIAEGIPSAASICYDPVRNQIIAPMNNQNAIAIITLD